MKMTNEREKLAAAIEKQHAAQATLDEARLAVQQARTRWTAANERVGEIERAIEDAEENAEHSPDALIADLAAGGDAAVLDKPKARLDELRAELQAAEHRSRQWLDAVKAAEQAVEVRQRALEQAAFFVESAAKVVMAQEVNVAAMLCNVESARNIVLDLQAKLAAIANAMTHDSEQRRSIDRVVNDASWLADSHEIRRDRQGAKAIRDAFARLKADASAPLEI
jgi:hypothetical protein